MDAPAKPFLDVVAGRPLSWTQPERARASWEVKAGDEVIAKIARRRWYGPTLRIESHSDTWDAVMTWTGFALRRPGEKVPVIKYRSMLFARGRLWLGEEELLWRGQFHWFRRMSYELQSASETPMIRVLPRFEPLRYQGDLEITDFGKRHRQIEPLLVFSVALALFSHRRRAH